MVAAGFPLAGTTKTHVNLHSVNNISFFVITNGIFSGLVDAVTVGMVVAVGAPALVNSCFFCCSSSRILRLFISEADKMWNTYVNTKSYHVQTLLRVARWKSHQNYSTND